MQLRSQRWAAQSTDCYVPAETAFGLTARGVECADASDSETEAWRACQRSVTPAKRDDCLGDVGFARVYRVGGSRPPRLRRPPLFFSPAPSQVEMPSITHAAAIQPLNGAVVGAGQ